MQKIKIAITDSGLGGLAIAAEVFEKLLRVNGIQQTEIVFVNALPETGNGYNKMKSEDEKIKMFNRVLDGTYGKFKPEFIAVACNTLSALIEKTEFYRARGRKILNIIDLTVKGFLKRDINKSNSILLIFGTETTIESRIYERSFLNAGFNEKQIMQVACPRLASEIELDYNSLTTEIIVNKCVNEALARNDFSNKTVYIILGCTHYPYVLKIFEKYLRAKIIGKFEIINPNSTMVSKILESCSAAKSERKGKSVAGNVSIKVYSRAIILPEEIKSVSALLKPISGATAVALKNYILEKELF